jgi:uncharacterized protein (DUF488 family)
MAVASSTSTTVPTILTVGHSNRSGDEFMALLARYGVERLVDVRRFAGSSRLPQFGRDQLPPMLEQHGIDYRQAPGLGGRRRPADPGDDDPGGAWRHPSFRAYAQHAQTDEYRDALHALLELARDRVCAIMCSEAVPWRCHRWLVADTLVAHDVRVLHIISPTSLRQHQLTSFAQVDGNQVRWPGPASTARLTLGPTVAADAWDPVRAG